MLVRRRENRHWEPPGGVLELDEPIEAGLCREVWEEAGLVVEPVTLTGVYKNMTRAVIALVFRCRVLPGQLATNDEVSGFCWATLEEVRLMVDEAFAVRVLDAFSDSPVPAVRQHDGVNLIR